MISAVRNVSFGESAQELINAEGRYNTQAPIPEAAPDSFESTSSKKALAVTGGVIAGAIALAGGLAYAYRHGQLDALKAGEEVIEGTFKKLFANAKDLVYKAGEKCSGLYDKAAGLLNRKAANAAEAAEEAAK